MQVVDIELGLTKKSLSALLFQLDHLPQQHTHRCLGHSTVRLELVRTVAGEILKNRSKIGEIEQQQALCRRST